MESFFLALFNCNHVHNALIPLSFWENENKTKQATTLKNTFVFS
jgi:hypothetical protein